MAVTRSTIETRRSAAPAKRAGRWAERFWFLAAILIVCAIWWIVFTAKIRRSASPAPSVILTDVDRSEKLLPALTVFPDPVERLRIATKIFDAMADRDSVIPNTTVIERIRADKGPLLTRAQFAQIKPQIAVR